MHPDLDRHLREFGLHAASLPSDPLAWRAFLRRLEAALQEAEVGRDLLEDALRATDGSLADGPPAWKVGQHAEPDGGRDFAAMLGSAGDGIIAFDCDARVGYANPAAARVLACSGDALATALLDRVRPSSEESAVSALRVVFERVLATGETFRDEHAVLLPIGDTDELPLSLVLTRVERDGCAHGVVVVFRDNRAIRRAHERLIAEREAAERASRSKGDFLATMSHEIRTPMNGVLGMVGLLLETELSPTQREFAETVHNSGTSLLALLNDILDFSKIEAGRLDLERVPFDLHGAIDDVAGLLAQRVQERGVELVCNIDPAIPEVVCGDPSRFRQVLTNLLGNAAKFTEQGEIAVYAALVRQDGDAVDVRVSVSDTGIGIPRDAVARLFSAWSQADDSTARRFGGSGLGLAICKRIAERMGGGVGVRSAPGRGSTFWFTVRFENAVLELPPESPFAGTRTLIVDDNGTFREFVQAQLKACGLRCTSVPDGEQALAAARAAQLEADPYRIVVLDYGLPGEDGLEVARALRALRGSDDQRVLLLTTWCERPSPEATAQAGVAAIINKPARARQILRALNQILSGPEVASAARRSARPRRSRPGRILLAEDNPVNQKVALHMLHRQGHEVHVVCNGREAVEAMESEPFDLVLMDCQMPEMDGFEAARQIRAREGPASRRTPIVAMTARVLQGDREQCLDAGMDDYLAKPFQPEDIDTIVDRWLLGVGS